MEGSGAFENISLMSCFIHGHDWRKDNQARMTGEEGSWSWLAYVLILLTSVGDGGALDGDGDHDEREEREREK